MPLSTSPDPGLTIRMDLDTNYWMGLDRLHTLTSFKTYGLRVGMTTWDGKTFWAEYGRLNIGPESGNYSLNLGLYNVSSTAPEEMIYNNGCSFTTYDRDNDRSKYRNCARDRKGGWWYNQCSYVNSTGVYQTRPAPSPPYNCNKTGINWWNRNNNYCPFYSYKTMTMTLIPK